MAVRLRGKKSIIEILATLRKMNCNSAEIFFTLFDAHVVPTLLHGADIWGYRSYDQIESVHLFACKRFLHVVDNTTNNLVYGELGRYPLWITAVVKCTKYWFRLLRQPDNLLSKKAHTKMLLTFDGNGYVTCMSRVRSLLCINGFEQVWLFGCGGEDDFVREL